MIPQSLYPESFSSSSSGRLNQLLTSKLREYSLKLRSAPSTSAARQLKSKFMQEVFNTLSVALGSPPKPDDKLSWEYYDNDNKYHQWTGTPKEFYDNFGRRKGMDPKDSFSLINDPRNKYEKLYSVERLGNIKDGKPVRCKWRIDRSALTARCQRPYRSS
jgi:bleomycin hydrolase